MIEKIKCWLGFHKMNDFDAMVLMLDGGVTSMYKSRCAHCNKLVRWI